MDENTDDAAVVISEAQVVARVSHKYTQRDGWRYESSVTITAVDNVEAIERLIVEYERLTDRLGRAECEARNVSDEGERLHRERQAAA